MLSSVTIPETIVPELLTTREAAKLLGIGEGSANT
jgi:hypothetical protein